MSDAPHPIRAHVAFGSRRPKGRRGGKAQGQTEATGVGDPAVAIEQLLYADHLVRVTCTVRPGPSLIRVTGEIDSTNSTELLGTLEQARRIDRDLVVDIGRVSFTDVTGIRALAAFAGKGGARIRNTPRQMRRLMRLMQVPPFERPGG
ncbi:STAS domain-containing protein [Nonomuraea sp. NPDC049480]|uniref:STAS domain-containing protein n=1 Tax=Nonomuraea sp. NPDC049480 TaxID=3364353 RepID=UPI00379E8455